MRSTPSVMTTSVSKTFFWNPFLQMTSINCKQYFLTERVCGIRKTLRLCKNLNIWQLLLTSFWGIVLAENHPALYPGVDHMFTSSVKLGKPACTNLCRGHYPVSLYLFIFFLFMATLQHEVPRPGVESELQLQPMPRQCQILNPLSLARDWTRILTEMSGH